MMKKSGFMKKETEMKKIEISFENKDLHIDAVEVGKNEIKSVVYALIKGLLKDFGASYGEVAGIFNDAVSDYIRRE